MKRRKERQECQRQIPSLVFPPGRCKHPASASAFGPFAGTPAHRAAPRPAPPAPHPDTAAWRRSAGRASLCPSAPALCCGPAASSATPTAPPRPPSAPASPSTATTSDTSTFAIARHRIVMCPIAHTTHTASQAHSSTSAERKFWRGRKGRARDTGAAFQRLCPAHISSQQLPAALSCPRAPSEPGKLLLCALQGQSSARCPWHSQGILSR